MLRRPLSVLCAWILIAGCATTNLSFPNATPGKPLTVPAWELRPTGPGHCVYNDEIDFVNYDDGEAVGLPSPADRPPTLGNWIHEIKHDGYRMMAWRDAGSGCSPGTATIGAPAAQPLPTKVVLRP